jgi:hypothetical protein
MSYVTGERIEAGQLVFLGEDGKLYAHSIPIFQRTSAMPHEICHTFICDICGFVFPSEERRQEPGMLFTDVIRDPRNIQVYKKDFFPMGFNFIEGKLVCYKHRIFVEQNGHLITVKEAEM